jgi:hypothetical protein
MSLNRNRTAPRILTVVNFRDATSLSIILLEQASKSATSFFVSSCKTVGLPGLLSTSICIFISSHRVLFSLSQSACLPAVYPLVFALAPDAFPQATPCQLLRQPAA